MGTPSFSEVFLHSLMGIRNSRKEEIRLKSRATEHTILPPIIKKEPRFEILHHRKVESNGRRKERSRQSQKKIKKIREKRKIGRRWFWEKESKKESRMYQ